MVLLERMLGDLFGPMRLVRERVLPAEVLYGLRGFRPSAAAPGERWLVTYALDVVRCADGAWRVVRDVTDAPSGLGSALLVRGVVARLLPDALRLAGVAPIDQHFVALRRALLACAPRDRRSPRCVLLTPGPAFGNYVEQSYLATQLGYHLVEGADLVMREGRLWLRALDGLEPVDVLFRRVDDDQLDPLESRTSAGVGLPGLVWGAQRGGIGVANSPGSGVAEAPQIAQRLDDIATWFGESLQLQRFSGSSPVATTPVLTGDGSSFTSGEVVVRLHLVAGPDGVSVMPGATARLTSMVDGERGPSSVLKDVWVVDGQRSAYRPASRGTFPQVDLFTSLPKRAADSLFWLGRAAERAEVAARTAREVRGQISRDPDVRRRVHRLARWRVGHAARLAGDAELAAPSSSTTMHRGCWPTSCSARRRRSPSRSPPSSPRRCRCASSCPPPPVGCSGAWRPPGFASRARTPTRTRWTPCSSTSPRSPGWPTRARFAVPAWRFLDIGRRLERALAVLGSLEAGLGPDVDAFTLQPLAETVLAANESLVTYRRRYRSDIVLDAVVDLLVGDDSNPRSLTFQLDRLREHMAALAWADGLTLVDRASIGALSDLDDRVTNGRRLSLDALVVAVRGPLLEMNGAIVRRWFADPVNPTMMSGR